jgi:tetratricopeptide (TPR) repeat protein
MYTCIVGDKQFRSTCHAEAITSYTRAINADPQAIRWGAILYNNRAAANMHLGHLTEAIADCHQAIGRDSNYSKAYLRRARALAASLSYTASIRDYRRYLCSDPLPSDMITVNQELESVVEAHRRQVQRDLEKREREEQKASKKSYKEAPWGDFNRNSYSGGNPNPYYDIPPPTRGGGVNGGFKYNSEGIHMYIILVYICIYVDMFICIHICINVYVYIYLHVHIGKSNYQSYTGSSSGNTYVVDNSDDDEDDIYEGYTNSKPGIYDVLF